MKKSNMTLGEAIDRYIDSKSAVLSPSTIYGYKKNRKQYMQDLIHISIRQLEQETIQRSINNEASIHSPKTVRNAYGLVHASLQMFRPDFIPRITLPQRIKSQFYVPDDNEIRNIYLHIKGHPLEIPFLLASKCGLRPSEICALTKDCISKCNIEIRKAVVISADGKEVIKPPKTFSGYRNIPIPKEFEEMLLSSTNSNKICTLSSNKISRDWPKFLSDNKLPLFKFYALRHYFASQALLIGIPQKYIAELMGHSSLDMIERVYQHTFKSAMDSFKIMLCTSTKQLIEKK